MCNNIGSPFWNVEPWSASLFIGLIVFLVLLGVTVLVLAVMCLRKLMVPDFNKKAVFITGADKGFGLSVVLELERRGLTVFAGCHSEASAARLRQQVSGRVKTVVIEVTDRVSVIKARKVIQADLPPEGLWGLVNNAGIAKGIVFDFAQVKDYKEVFEVNFFGTINVTEEFLPLIKASKGRVVNMISIMGRFSGVVGPYSCTKFALEAYNDGLRRSLKDFGVKVSAIEPGFYKTKMTDRKYVEEEINRLWDDLPEGIRNDYGLL